MDKPVLLLVEDRPNLLRLLASVLGQVARVVPAGGVREALNVIEREHVAAVLCDMRMPDGDGLDVLRALKGKWPSAPFILMTAYATVDTAVQAMREGAYDHVTKPFDPDAVLALVERALASAVLAGHGAPDHPGLGILLGRSVKAQELAASIKRVTATDAPALFVGEEGCGKRTAARAVHDTSGRSRPFKEVSCALASGSDVTTLLGTSREGLAEDGVVLLRDVEQLAPQLQEDVASVLRSLTRGASPRVLASSCSTPAVLAEGLVPELWFELNVCVVEVPTLRDRHEDVPLLATHFLRERSGDGAPERTFAPDAIEILERYLWPGNVRELRSVVHRAALTSPERIIRVASLPPEITAGHPHAPVPADEVLAQLSLKEAIELSRGETNRRYLEVVLRKFNGDVIAAADFADVERESFYRLLRRYGIAARAFRRPE